MRFSSETMPGWGRRLTAPCTECGILTHRHRTLDYDGVNTYRPQAGPDPARLEGDSDEPDLEPAWIALIPGNFPFRRFALDEVFHLAGGIAWPGPHHRDYGVAKIAHGACCPMLHPERPDSSRGAGELWQAMRLRMLRDTSRRIG
ncbi:hypothetical protein BM536_037680 [Streptomyces phaeoluteigriseus]|uniref:Uncharacterized protein n=1 Tax=Streptomyces phaeoluteigriseus TaxID=114686 RepID=A0A1V6MH96_9ACTN|nr:hypothetical protein [Streptomyces phaeoluteigriseus]OQD51849.1 hypothetical protein BM536_037680 [Streptomyces phaeoluteigriseus]